MPNSLENLKLLKAKLHSGKMSVLVGSGFSKNVSEKFPNWTELLQDLVIELFPREFELLKRIKSKTKQDYLIKEKVDELINEIGYLEAVSRYIEKKGFEESICTYIENNIPLLERVEDHIYIEHKGMRELLDEKSLDNHRNLVNLPWNNIYTTNYDQLLEFCVDENLQSKLEQEIKNLRKEINDLEEKINDLEEQPNKKIINPLKLTEAIPNSQYSNNNNNEEINNLQNKITRLEISIKEKEDQKYRLKKVITDESELALKHQNNIIKLHGSLRTKDERLQPKFEFSGDPNVQYIISKEHYKSYEQKHPAFMNLMRISLLQESFCLIGFSGDDPNFLEWLMWVKSILKRSNIKETKVYFIHLGDGTEISEDKKLFFYNNNIGVISLNSNEVLELLECNETNISKKSIISQLIKFLNDKTSFSTNHYDHSLTNEYEKIWLELGKVNGENKDALKKITELEKIKAEDAIFPLNYTTEYRLQNISFTLSKSIDEFYSKNIDNRWYQLVGHAIEDLRIPISIINKDNLNIDLDFNETILKRLNKYDEVFSGKINGFESENSFLKLMSLAYSFDYENLYKYVTCEDSQKICPIVTSSILALYSPKKAFNILNNSEHSHFHNSKVLLIKKLRYSFYQQSTFNLNNDFKNEINALESQNVPCILKEVKNIAKNIITQNEKPLLIGANRHGIGRNLTFTNLPPNLDSIRYVYSLFKIGLQQNISGRYLLNNEDWYKIHITGYELYPIPYLFYSLQCSSEDIIRRIGQDYATNIKIKSVLPIILKNLLKNSNFQCNHLHNSFKSNLIIFSTEILISVPPSFWQDYFFENVDSNIEYFDQGTKTFNHFLDLTLECLKYTNKKQYLIQTLENFLFDHSLDIILNITYGVVSNKKIKLDSRSQTRNLKNSINSIIANLEDKLENNLYLIGNIKQILSKRQIIEINDKLSNLNLTQFKSVEILNIIASFGASKTLKNLILNSNKLWYTGISTTKYSSGEYISLSQFKLKNKSLANWNKQELIEIYNKLIPEFENIVQYLEKDKELFWTITHLKGILKEMYYFLKSESDNLKHLNTYKNTLQRVKDEYFKIRGYREVSEAIYSEDDKVIADSIRELDNLIYTTAPSKYIDEIKVVIFRIVTESGSKGRIEQCIYYVEEWIRRENIYNIDSLKMDIIKILKKFSEKKDFSGYDLPFVYEKLISIAKEIKATGLQSEIVEFWLRKSDEKIFNNL